jgi:hypothetical protein
MIRCALMVALLAAAPAIAQNARSFPANALRGELMVTQPPEVLLNGQPARLAPGSRILGPGNLLQLSGGLIGQRFVVHYTTDPAGQPLMVWILSPAEAARQPWPTTAAEASAWRFDAAAQAWTKP